MSLDNGKRFLALAKEHKHYTKMCYQVATGFTPNDVVIIQYKCDEPGCGGTLWKYFASGTDYKGPIKSRKQTSSAM